MRIAYTKIVFAVVACCASFGVRAFELTTHAMLTNRAYAISVLGSQPDRLTQLGLTNLPSPFGRNYYDFTNTLIARRSANAFELSKFASDARVDEERINGWLMRGAIREDDLVKAGAQLKGDGQPWILDPDPAGDISRVCNHFLNPITRSPMVVPFGFTIGFWFCPDVNYTAVNWAIGTADAFATNPQEAANYRNHFTIFSAREAMWRALTLTSKSGGAADRVAGDSNEQVRKAYWATTFRALGGAAHLLQDMAQPQHTRNEPHSSDSDAVLENFTEARAKGERTFKFLGQTLSVEAAPPLPLSDSYPIPRFDRYSDYWSTAAGADSFNVGKGLADYSSRGFFTPNQSLGDSFSGFPRPINMESAYTISKNPPAGGNPCPGLVLGFPEYAWANVPDTISGVPSNPVRMGSRSLLPSRWAISRCVLLDQGNLLIPRAVAYSAGLIDYFFRGQLEITPPAEGIYSLVDHFDFSGDGKTATNATTGFKGFKTIKLKLRNTTPDITPSGGGAVAPQHMQNGKLLAVLKFHRNKAYTDNLANEPTTIAGYDATRSAAEEIVVSARVKDENGALVNTISLSADPATPAKLLYFEFDQELPINATDVKLQVVYRGTLGSEADAVVVQTADISEPTYFAYMNTSDYIRLNAKVYTRAEINSNGTPPTGELSGSQLRALVRPTNCIDPLTDQLRASCFPEKAINFPLRVGASSTENNTTLQFALPQVRTYVRMAMLTPRGVPALLDQRASSCVPRDIFPLRGRNVQTDYSTDADGSTRISRVVDIDPPPVRGVYGYVLSCVEIGDGTIPGANDADNRDTKMAPLTGTALKPLLLQNFKFGAP